MDKSEGGGVLIETFSTNTNDEKSENVGSFKSGVNDSGGERRDHQGNGGSAKPSSGMTDSMGDAMEIEKATIITEVTESVKKKKKKENLYVVGALCSVEFEDPIGWIKGTIVKVEHDDEEESDEDKTAESAETTTITTNNKRILIRYHKFVEEEWMNVPSDSVRIHRTSPLRLRVENALMGDVSESNTIKSFLCERTSVLKKKVFPSSIKSLFNKIIWVRQSSFPWWPALVVQPEFLFGTGWKMFKTCDTKSVVVVYLGWGDGFVFHKTRVEFGKTVVMYTCDEKDDKLRSGFMKPLISSSSIKSNKKKSKSVSPALLRQLEEVSLPLADDWLQMSEKQIVEGWKEHAGWFLDSRRFCYEKLIIEYSEIITLELEMEEREYVSPSSSIDIIITTQIYTFSLSLSNVHTHTHTHTYTGTR